MTQQPRGSGPDPVGDFQRWLLRSGVRGVSREVSGHVRGLLGGGRSKDVWETATAPPPEEAPECAWCPICRAARLLRESRPGLASHMAAAGDTLSGVVQDAMSTVEAALAAAQRAAAENTRAHPTPAAEPAANGSAEPQASNGTAEPQASNGTADAAPGAGRAAEPQATGGTAQAAPAAQDQAAGDEAAAAAGGTGMPEPPPAGSGTGSEPAAGPQGAEPGARPAEFGGGNGEPPGDEPAAPLGPG